MDKQYNAMKNKVMRDIARGISKRKGERFKRERGREAFERSI